MWSIWKYTIHENRPLVEFNMGFLFPFLKLRSGNNFQESLLFSAFMSQDFIIYSALYTPGYLAFINFLSCCPGFRIANMQPSFFNWVLLVELGLSGLMGHLPAGSLKNWCWRRLLYFSQQATDMKSCLRIFNYLFKLRSGAVCSSALHMTRA